MKKQKTLLIVLLAVLAVFAGVYFGLRAWNGGADDREDQGKTRVAALSDITAISFTNKYGSFAFSKAEGVWRYDADTEFPLDGAYLDTLAQVLSDLTAVRVFPTPDALSGYGLEEPSCSVSAKTAGGEEAVILVGSAAGSDYYAKRQDGETVYTISSSLPDALNYRLNDLAVLESIPAAGEAALESIQVTQGAQSVKLTKKSETVESEPSGGPSDTQAPQESARPETVYKWYLDGAELEKGSVLNAALSKLSSMAFTACHDYKPDADALALCGLDSPAAVVEVAGGEGAYTLEIGTTDADGNYYARLNGTGPVYLLDAGRAEALTALTRAGLGAE